MAQFRTVCRIGYWLHVDAMWTTEQGCGLTINYVRFNLVDGWSNHVPVGYSIITTDDTGFVVADEDGEQFPDLETAIRHHAEELLKVEWQWTDWQGSPPLHPSKSDGKSTEVAFSPRDIAREAQMRQRRAGSSKEKAVRLWRTAQGEETLSAPHGPAAPIFKCDLGR